MRFSFRCFPMFFFLIFAAARAWGQSPGATLEERLAALERRVEQLEQENRHLRAQGSQLPAPKAAKPVLAAGESPETAAAVVASAKPVVAAQGSTALTAKATPPEKKLPGLEVGPWRVTPYGTAYLNFFSNSGGTNNADNPLFAGAGHGNMSATVRQTRLGLRLEGPQLYGGKLSGAFETDFMGGLPGIGVGEMFPLLRLRLAYARLQWERTSLVVGQDWMIFSPTNPVSIASAAIPQLATAGNLWQRLPQIRVERRGGKSVKWLGQAAIVVSGTGDFPSTAAGAFLLQPGAGARARTPHFQARISATGDNWAKLGQAATFGISGHYGRARATTSSGDQESDVFGTALDWSLPLVPRLTLAGEAFLGRNLAEFQGGIFQGVNPDFANRQGFVLVPGGARGIGTRGGWTQLGFTPPGQDKLTLYASYGLDDPRGGDLVSSPARDWRKRNQAYAFSFLHKLSGQLTWGLEFRRMETQNLQSGKRSNNHVNLGVAASF